MKLERRRGEDDNEGNLGKEERRLYRYRNGSPFGSMLFINGSVSEIYLKCDC
jgi:hypothetical protein